MNRVLAHVRQNVIAYLALFVALGGTSYAAVAIANHSITPVKFDRRVIGGYVRGWVEVSASGHVVASGGRWQVSEDPVAPGAYTIVWSARPDSRCTSVGSVDIVPGSPIVPGFVTSTTFSHRKREFTGVHTYNSLGQQTPLPFDLVMACATPR